jgi:hypothetical protein
VEYLQKIKQNYLEILPPALFFFIAFSLILVTKRLVLSEYGITWTGFGAAFVGAMMVGKVVLVVDKLPYTNRFHDRQLICNASWKCLIYLLAAELLQYLERVVPLALKNGGFAAAHRLFMVDTVWPHFLLIQMWLTVLFFVYCSLRELIRAIGREKVVGMFFGGRSGTDQITNRISS